MLLEKLKDYNIILASGSPRRKQLLQEMGIEFSIITKPVKEIFPEGLSPEQAAEYLSKLKAEAFGAEELTKHSLLITADTIVSCRDQILGKPSTKGEAIEILELLSGKTHEVITGVTLKTTNRQITFNVSTDVTFSQLSAEEIDYYIDTYKPYDKAGAYGIQEWIGHAAIEKIQGSYFNVMGLPTHRLYIELNQFV